MHMFIHNTEAKLSMKAQENLLQIITDKASPAIFFFALLLCAFGAFIVFSWIFPFVFGGYHNIILTAYNTAICLGISGAALIALLHKKLWLVRIFALVTLSLSAISLTELFWHSPSNVNFWFIENSTA